MDAVTGSVGKLTTSTDGIRMETGGGCEKEGRRRGKGVWNEEENEGEHEEQETAEETNEKGPGWIQTRGIQFGT